MGTYWVTKSISLKVQVDIPPIDVEDEAEDAYTIGDEILTEICDDLLFFLDRAYPEVVANVDYRVEVE
jgi:hypothetical protein